MKNFLKKLLDEGLGAFLKYAFGENSGVYYINGSESLPPPLTRAEEEEAFRLMETDFAAARETLIVHNLRLVVYIAKKFENTGVGLDDLISIGTIGLIKAVSTFSVHRNIKLATYASRCIENEILMYFRSQKKQDGDVFLGDTIDTDKDGNPLTIEDIISDDCDLAENLETKVRWLKVKKYIENMTDPREQKIIVLRYGLNNKKPLTQREVAELLNISRSYVSRIEKKVLDDIKQNCK